jgi:hemolysin activation/secretion protein
MMHQAKNILRTTLMAFSTGGALFLLASAPAHAQVPDAQSGIASPGRVEEQIKTPEFQRNVMPSVQVRELEIQGAPAGAEKIIFVLDRIQIDGATAYTQEDLSRLYQDRIGQKVSLADLYGIAGQMTRKYRNDGYILTQVVVPPQTIQGGTAKLQVVEGYLDHVDVQLEQGARAETEAAMAFVRSYAARITTGSALNVKDLEHYMLLINDLPGVSARGVLAPSKTRPGAADLSIVIQRNPFDAIISADNYGTRFLGPLQFSGAASFNSLFGHNERLTGQAVIAPDTGNGIELGYLALGYAQPLLPNGLKLELNGNYTGTKPGYTLDEFDVRGRSQFFSAGLSYPVIRSRATSLYTNVTFDFRNVTTSNDIEATRKDRIRALRVGARLEHLDTIFGAGVNIFDVEIAQGLDFLGATDKNDANKSRAEGDGEFTKLNIEMQRLQRLAPQWNVLVGLRGQLSNDALLSSEEFGVGGLAYGRGFDPSEIIGDEGIAGKVELQWNAPGTLAFFHDNQVFGFYDGGRIWNDDPATNSQKTDTATSAGFGVRAKILEYTKADFTVAFPLDRDVQTQQDRDPRVYFSLSRTF